MNGVERRASQKQTKKQQASQEERLQKWNGHFNNLPINPSEITDKPVLKFINGQLDTKLGLFKEEELDAELEKNKSKKAANHDKITVQ